MRNRSSSWAEDGENSDAVSRHGPRSMAMTSSPASHSSVARIEPVQPRPMMTASFAGNFFAIANLVAARWRSLARPVGMILDRCRRDRDGLIMPVDPLAVIVMRAGKSDHLPGRHVLVAAVDRIGEKALLRIVENKLEEVFSAALRQLELVVLQILDDLVLAGIRQLGKNLAEGGAAMAVEGCESLAIMLGGGDG